MAIYYPRAKAVIKVLLDSDDGEQVHTFDAVPRSVEIKRNTQLEADTFDLTLDYGDFPLDPRSLRAVQVGLFLGDVGGADREDQIMSAKYRAFLGYADVPSTDLSEDDQSVRLTGRDYTGLFLDDIWKPQNKIEIDQTMQSVLEYIISKVPGAEDIKTEFSAQASSGKNTKLSDLLGKTIWTQRGKDDDSWTVLVDLFGAVGLLPVIVLDTLTIVAPGEVRDVQAYLQYGQNINRLEFSKNLNNIRRRQIKIVSWDAAAGVSRSATYPEKPIIIAKRISTKGKVKNETAPIVTFSVSGSQSKAELLARARNIYEQEARQQIEGKLETSEMRVPSTYDKAQKQENDVQLCALANGDSVVVQLSAIDRAGLLALNYSEAVETLVANGMRSSVARALISSLKQANRLAISFYVKTATHSWDRDAGYTLNVNFINFLGDRK